MRGNAHERAPDILRLDHAFFLLGKFLVIFVRFRSEELEGFFDFGFFFSGEVVLLCELGEARLLGFGWHADGRVSELCDARFITDPVWKVDAKLCLSMMGMLRRPE